MAAAIPFIYVASAALAAVGAVQSARQQSAAQQSQANMADYQSKVAVIRADQINAAAGLQEDQQRQKARAVIGQQLANSAEAGAGLNADLLRQSIYNENADSAAIRYDAALKASGQNDEAALQQSNAAISRSRAGDAMSAGYLNAASSLARSASSYYGGKSLN